MYCRLPDMRLREDDGISIIELTAALFVLSVGIMGTLQMYHVGVAKLGAMSEAAIAVGAVQNELETLHALPFDALHDTASGAFVSETPALKQLCKAEPKVIIADYDPACPGLKQVTASVRWFGEHGRPIEKSLTTLIADKDGSHGHEGL